jgi:hypothetical protein
MYIASNLAHGKARPVGVTSREACVSRSTASEVQAINTYEKTDIKCYRNVTSVLLFCYYFSVVQDFVSNFGHVDIWLWFSGLEGRLPLQSSINWLYQRLYATILAS